MSKKRGNKKGIVSRGERVVDDVCAALNDVAAIDDASANSLQQDQDEGSGQEPDSEWEEDKTEVNSDSEIKEMRAKRTALLESVDMAYDGRLVCRPEQRGGWWKKY
jgi:hypothetical protein